MHWNKRVFKQALVERLENGRSIEDTINTDNGKNWKYTMKFTSENYIERMEKIRNKKLLSHREKYTREEQNYFESIKIKYWLPTNTTLLQLLSFLKNADHTLPKTL